MVTTSKKRSLTTSMRVQHKGDHWPSGWCTYVAWYWWGQVECSDECGDIPGGYCTFLDADYNLIEYICPDTQHNDQIS